MAAEQVLPFSVVSVVEDVLQQHGGPQLTDIVASRKAEEASLRRYEAAGWLRKTVGVVGGKDLPSEPSEEEFRAALRSGIILCYVLNKVKPGAVSKVVEAPCDSQLIPDGRALSAFQYFENVRNFLVAVEEMGLPTFEVSDLEQGGKSSRVVNCVLALKSYNEWKEGGKNKSWKYVVTTKPPTSGKPFQRKSSEPVINSLSRTTSVERDGWMSDHSSYSDPGNDRNEGVRESFHLSSLVREYLSDKKQEEIPSVVESLLSKVMEEFQHRLASENEVMKINLEPEHKAASEMDISSSTSKSASEEQEMEEKEDIEIEREQCEREQHYHQTKNNDEESRSRLLKQHMLVEQQTRDIQELKNVLHHTKAGMQLLQQRYNEDFIYLGKHLQSLASAASGYQRVLEENRKLYNQVQDLKGNIRVYCRVRPLFDGQSNQYSTVSHLDEGSLTIVTPSKYGKEGKKTFNFNRVFGPSATQAEVFSDTQPLIRSVLDGYNVCIFAYGQTGAGKTHTMSGPNDPTEETVGVNYRALRDLFLLSEQRKETISYDISVQMLEIYNEQVRDLLATDGSNRRLEIRNSSQNGINVPDANRVPVSSTSDVISLMNLGDSNRAVGATAMNDRSSRSHSCLTVHVQGRDLTSGAVLRGCIHLVDLAGSERADKSEATGERLKEAQHINKSLSALGDVISSLAQKQTHVPYRNSKLTQLLQDSLGGQAKTLMFVHISPELDALGETLSTLKFAERVSTIELGAARVNKDGADTKELKEQIATLKAALERKEGEVEPIQQSATRIPEMSRIRSLGSGGHRQPKDDASGMEGGNKSASKLKRRSLDLHDMMRTPPAWSQVSGSQRMNRKEDNRESITGEWVDKVMVNRRDSLTSEEGLVEQWEGERKQFSPIFSSPTGYLAEPSKICLEHSIKVTLHKKDGQDYEEHHVQRSRYEMGDDSDRELEAATATSDSSESDLSWLGNIPKPTASRPNKSSQSRTAKTETRSMIPSLIPTPSRKQPNVGSQTRKKAGTGDGKKKTLSSK